MEAREEDSGMSLTPRDRVHSLSRLGATCLTHGMGFPLNRVTLKVAIPFVCAFLMAGTPSTKAQSVGPTGRQAAGIFAILIAVPVAVGIGVYYLVRAPRNVTGCVSGSADALQLTEEAGKTYLLEGQMADVKVNERVRLSGKASKNAQKRKTFAVTKLSHDYGACASPAAVR